MRMPPTAQALHLRQPKQRASQNTVYILQDLGHSQPNCFQLPASHYSKLHIPVFTCYISPSMLKVNYAECTSRNRRDHKVMSCICPLYQCSRLLTELNKSTFLASPRVY